MFPGALLSLAAVLIIFSLGWQNVHRLSHVSISFGLRAAGREFGEVQTRRQGTPAPSAISEWFYLKDRQM